MQVYTQDNLMKVGDLVIYSAPVVRILKGGPYHPDSIGLIVGVWQSYPELPQGYTILLSSTVIDCYEWELGIAK